MNAIVTVKTMGGEGSQKSRIWRQILAYDYAYEGAVRVGNAMACHASEGARGIIRGASLRCMLQCIASR